MELKEPHQMLRRWGGCKALLTLALLMLLTLATSARALAEENPKPYAVFDNKTGTLTFYYDNQFNTFTDPMDLNEGDAAPAWSNHSPIKTVEFDKSFQNARPTTCKAWFAGRKDLTEIKGIEYLNTSQVANMSNMFSGCEALTSLDLSSFNTSAVTDMSAMFSNCSHLKTILVGDGWYVGNITRSGIMFYNCTKLIGGNGTSYNESNTDATRAIIDGDNNKQGYLTSADQLTNFSPFTELIDHHNNKDKTLMFSLGYNPNGSRSLDPSNWKRDVSYITTVVFDPIFRYARPTTCKDWFFNCTNLTEIKGIEYLNTSQVNDMSKMFYGCSSLKSLDLSSFNTSQVNDMSCMFYGCPALQSLDISSFNTSQVNNMGGMFSSCSALTSLDLSSFNTSAVEDMSYMFYVCSALKTILAGDDWNVEKKTNSFDMFYGCENLTGGNGTSFKDYGSKDLFYVIDGKDGKPGYLTSPSQCTPYAELTDDGKTLVFRIGYEPTFEGNVKPLNGNNGLPGWTDNLSTITTVIFDPMFRHARPKTCSSWFCYCVELKEIKGIEYLNTSKVTDMSYMFYCCSSLKYLDLSSFNTSEVTDMGFMFSVCQSLKSLDLSSFNTSKVICMDYMFAGCYALESLDLSSFNTSKVTYMSNMFYGCNTLELLDLSSFNTSIVENMNMMFYGCKALKTILVGDDWDVNNVQESTNMFNGELNHGCENLIGGKGTKYDEDHIDATYAIIDGKDGKPGYLTSPSQCTPYAELTDEGKTLVFRLSIGYEPTFEGNIMPLNEDDNYPAWYDEYDSKITTVVFDPMFRHARPKTCYCWFSRCFCLDEIKGIEYLNTSEVETMNYMFDYCALLKSLDLSSFNTKEVKNMDGMFYNCMILENILVGEGWKVSNETESEGMFTNCVNLTGGNGTKCDGIVDATRAVIDGKDDTPGYLTLNALKISEDKTTAELQGNFTDGSGAAVVINKATKVDELTFYRQFTKEVTSTVMFPFSFNAKEQGIQGTFHTVTKVGPDENGVWTALMSNSVTNIQANTPYIFNPSEDIAKSITFKDITLVPNNEILPNGTNGWQLNGVYSKKIWEQDSDDEYGFAGQEAEGIQVGEFVLAGEGAWADPMRCYLTYTGTGNPFSTAKSATVLPDRIRVVFPGDNNNEEDNEISTNPDEVVTPVSPVTEEAAAKVWAYNRTIFIESPTGSEYTVIDINGRQIKASTTESTHEEVNISKPGIFIVIIGGKSYKVNVN